MFQDQSPIDRPVLTVHLPWLYGWVASLSHLSVCLSSSQMSVRCPGDSQLQVPSCGTAFQLICECAKRTQMYRYLVYLADTSFQRFKRPLTLAIFVRVLRLRHSE